MIDSHVHLIWESFQADQEEVISRAEKAGVEAFIHSCVHTDDLPAMFEVAEKHPNVFIAAGVHPCDGLRWTEQSEKDIFKFKNKIVAVGETGLDYYHNDCPVDHQKSVFRKQCQIAKELKLPLIIHCRDAEPLKQGSELPLSRDALRVADLGLGGNANAFEDTLQILREENPGGGVMHCYTGNAEYSAKFWELGFYTSFSGCLTFKSAHKLREEAKKIPLEHTLIETDCPFLAPQKHRGKRNEPAFVTEVCEVLTQIHDKSFAYVDEMTTNNTKQLFRIKL